VGSRVVLDAQPVVAFLTGEPAADEVAALIAGERAQLSVAKAAEVLDVLIRVRRLDAEEARIGLDILLDEAVEAVPVTRPIALRAAELRAGAHRRRRIEVSFADCVAIATAEPDGRLATSDRALAKVARAEGVEIIALPDSRGRRP
jgi:predicted nucleic acid-binding protein